MKAIRTKGTVPRANVICHSIAPSSDFVLSGFSGSKNVTLPSEFTPESNPWEMVFKLTTGSSVSGQQQFLGGVDSVYAGVEAAVAGGKFKVWLGPSTSSYGIASGKTGTYTVLTNTTYWVKIAFDGSAYTLAYSLNGVDYTTDITVSSTTTICSARKSLGADKYSGDYVWTGSIDLKECYIDINGERWWNGVHAVEVDRYKVVKTKKLVPRANVTCYAITPSDDFVLSGFSSSKYAIVTDSFEVSSSTLEMVYKIKTGSDVTTLQTICGHTGSSIYDPVTIFVASSKFKVNITSSSGSTTIAKDKAGTYTVLANTTYWIKLTFNGSQYVLGYSLNGKDYVEDIVVASTATIWTSNLVLGRQQGSDSEYPFLGSIDLKGCYININGERYWNGVKGVLVDRYLMVR